MGKRNEKRNAPSVETDEMAFLQEIAAKGQPLAALSLAKQKKLLSILATEIKMGGQTRSGIDFESFRMGFLTASVVVKMFFCTGGGKGYDRLVNRLGVAAMDVVTKDDKPAKA